MKERPILFSGPMVRAILAGTKTQTRRVVTDATSQGNWRASDLDLSTAWVDHGPSPAGNPGPYLKARPTPEGFRRHDWPADDQIVDRLYPCWFPGDRPWVRESFVLGRALKGGVPRDLVAFFRDGRVHYTTDDCRRNPDAPEGCENWTLKHANKPSIHMPRWASRLTLEITDVRVQRVQEISEEDVAAEGVPRSCEEPDCTCWLDNFRQLWGSINGKRAPWASNPWVWALTFRRVDS